MATALDITPAGVIAIDGIFADHSFTIVVEQFADDEETPINFTGVSKMIICYDPAKTREAMELTEGAGLTRASNNITISRTKAQNTLEPATYYFDLYTDVDATTSYVILTGTLTVNPSAK